MLCSVFHLRNGPLFYIAIIIISLLFKVNSAVESVLETSPQPIVAVAGDDVILPCQLVPPVDARSMTVTWTKPGLDVKYIHVLKDGRQHWVNRNEFFRHQTVMFTDQLMNGNLSLKIFRVMLADAGRYNCIVSSFLKEASVQLAVGAVSTPTVEVSFINSQQMVLQCRSEGWCPEPSLSWLDGEGNLIPADHEETVKTANGLYDIVSTVVVKQHDNYTCRVQNPLNQTRLVRVPADFFRESDTHYSAFQTLVITLLVLASAILLAIYISRNQERSNSLSREAMLGPNNLNRCQTENPLTSENHPEDHYTAQHSTEQPGQESSDGNCSSWNGGSDACETSDQY